MRASRLLVLVTAMGVALTACTATPTKSEPSATPTAVSGPSSTPTPHSSSEPTATPSASPTVDAVSDPGADDGAHEQLTCETMLDPAVLARHQRNGLASQAKPVEVAHGVAPEVGISCPWGLAGIGGGEADAFYTWARFDPGTVHQLRSRMEESGVYRIEDTPEGTYMIDDRHKGWAYLFDGQVMKAAFAEEDLAHIVWPG